jgi:integrase/recombinase XerC
VRQKLNRIDGYFAFLEQRYRGELARRFDVTVEYSGGRPGLARP